MFKFIYNNAVKLYIRDLKDFISHISTLDQKEISDLLMHAVWTRAGLQNEGYIKNHDGSVNKNPVLNQYPILLDQFEKPVSIFKKQGANFQAASMSIWVHTLRGLIHPELEEETNKLWGLLMTSKEDWNQSIRNLYLEDVNRIDSRLLEETLKFSWQILKNLPPKFNT